MKNLSSGVKGVTMLELLLVIAVAASVILLGIRQYQVFQASGSVEDLKGNVDMLFDAAYRYYQVNCGPGGTLDPKTNLMSSYAVALSTLRTEGFLDTGKPLPNPLINSIPLDQDYIVQFNQASEDREICVDVTCSTMQKLGTTVVYKIQISANFTDTAKASLYKTYLVADCLSSRSTAYMQPTIALCSELLTGDYLVFERLPTAIASRSSMRSPLFPSMPRLMQNKMESNMAPMSYLLNVDHTTEYQYFACGS